MTRPHTPGAFGSSHRRPPDRPSVSVRPLPAPENAVEVRTHCRHGGFRIGYQLDERITERIAVTCALFHHASMEGCTCMHTLWPRYRAGHAPEDLAGLVARFNGVWADVEDQQRRQGFAVLDWAAACRTLSGEGPS